MVACLYSRDFIGLGIGHLMLVGCSDRCFQVCNREITRLSRFPHGKSQRRNACISSLVVHLYIGSCKYINKSLIESDCYLYIGK